MAKAIGRRCNCRQLQDPRIGPGIAVIAEGRGVPWCATRGDGRSVTTIPAICHFTTISILHRHNTDMGIRDSVSKPFKKLKNRFAESIRKRKEGSRSDSHREGGETDVEESEAGQSSHLHPETEDVAKSGLSREENGGEDKKAVEVNPSTSTPSISPIDSGKLNSM